MGQWSSTCFFAVRPKGTTPRKPCWRPAARRAFLCSPFGEIRYITSDASAACDSLSGLPKKCILQCHVTFKTPSGKSRNTFRNAQTCARRCLSLKPTQTKKTALLKAHRPNSLANPDAGGGGLRLPLPSLEIGSDFKRRSRPTLNPEANSCSAPLLWPYTRKTCHTL